MEVKNRLLNYQNLWIYQNDDWFNFSLDSILLANFVTLRAKVTKILDIGCGNGPIPLILSTRTKADITGIEIQPEIYNLAKKTIKENHLSQQIKLINVDAKKYVKSCESDTYDIIVSNPPFFKLDRHSKLNENTIKSNARHETLLNIDDVIKISRKLLKNKGILAIVHRTDRLIEILEIMRKNNIEPKRLQLIYPKKESNSNMFLLEGIKNGKAGLKIIKSLYIHNDNGDYQEEVLKMFE